MDTIKPVFTISATAIGGRNGHTETSDGVVKADLSVPKEMGGPGKPGAATPEHLFAAGYAACFGGSLDFVAKQKKRDAAKANITCAVTIGRAKAAGSASRSRCESRTRASRRPTSPRSSRRHTRRSARIRMPHVATWMWYSR
jgi:Ohr subfamily peroxiredoxin